MSETEKIVCKPTPWFLFRAAIMLLMFGVFAFLFYRDGLIGYRHKNASYFLRATFEEAANQLQAKSRSGLISPGEWRAFAEHQTVKLPADASILPPEVPPGMKWPEPLHDLVALREKQWQHLWRDYSAAWPAWSMDAEPPHEPYDAGKIREQWIVCAICLALSLIAAFFLIRTKLRSIAVDDDALYYFGGKRIPFAAMTRLDLRKWDTKGLAFIDYTGPAGSGRVRLDGLTYGGFKKDQDEPAEALMKRLRSRFSGELIEYAPLSEAEQDPATPHS